MAGRLEDKVALVTGAGSSGPGWGNGKATAVLFAREGARVVALDADLAAAEETADIIEAEGGQCLALETNVTSSEQVKAAVDRTVEVYGRLDILHNNVGIVEVGGPVEASEESWERVMAVNVSSMFLTCKHTLPHMVRQESGAIVNIGSVVGIRYLGVPYVSYSASKGAVLQLTQTVAMQYAHLNIRANCILPGMLATPMVTGQLVESYGGGVEEMLRRRDEQTPIAKRGDAWDVAWAAVYLASDEACFVTGAQLVVDGGLTCKTV